MLRTISKKIFIVLLIVPILVCLTALGLRLPTACGLSSSTPKQRPRAVIQTQTQKCKELFHQQELFTLTPKEPIPPIVLAMLPTDYDVESVFSPKTIVVLNPSRAPPANRISA
jgi:hypothetical protein